MEWSSTGVIADVYLSTSSILDILLISMESERLPSHLGNVVIL
jgi:hypothetical protein